MLRIAMILCACSLYLLTGCASGAPELPDVTALQRSLVDRIEIEPTIPASAHHYSSQFKVMSFNLRTKTMMDVRNGWRKRRDIIADTIEKVDPDIMGTQECTLPQARDLNKLLPEYGFVGVGREDGWDEGEMCGVFYRKSRFHRVNEGHFWLSETPEVPGSKSWGSAWPRMVTWVQLQPLAGGEELFVFNTHLDVMSARARVNGARLIREQIDAIAGNAPVIVTGDFNTDEDSQTYNELVVRQRLVDTFREAYPHEAEQEGTRHAFRGRTGGERIDWILASDTFDTIDAKIIRHRVRGKYPSDHFPVSATLRPQRQWAMYR